ncbi:MAG: hypothetical protein FJY85_25285, partial [Deltaproteobacteria bacterium]|nr:hypothetical protein [Deltaproteobacteria bacterium]
MESILMLARIVAIPWLLVSLLVVTGCDPKEMIEKKVPEPLKGFMAPEKGGRRGAGDAMEGALQPSALEVDSPKANSVLSVANDVTFRAKIDIPPAKDDIKPQIVWTLFSDKGQKGVQIGRGETLNKKLDPGRYRIQAALFYKDAKIEKEVAFRVACMTEGKVAAPDGTGVPGVSLVVAEIGYTKPLFQAQSDRGGKFSIELPQDASVELTPGKQGYSFYPSRRVVKFVFPVVLQEFAATKAEVKDIALAEHSSSKESVDSVCPL